MPGIQRRITVTLIHEKGSELHWKDVYELVHLCLCEMFADSKFSLLNRKEFVEAYVNHAFNTSVESLFQEFKRGFFLVCEQDLVRLFRPEELQGVLVGQDVHDWEKFKQNTSYGWRYHDRHPTIQMFWEVFDELTEEQRKDVLPGGLSRLTFHLAHVTHLERLDLHLCCLTRDDLEALIQVLPSLTALTELDVSSNKEVGGVVHLLVSALPATQMRRLPFNSCYMSNESFTALALAVSYLRTVDISWCKVVGGHLALLLDALQPSVVSELRLCSCELTTDDMQHLAAVCRRGCLSSLRALDLSYNSLVGDNGWCSLFAAGGLGSLEDVDVSLRPSTSAPCSAWLPALLRALPQMPALARLAMQRWTADCQEREQLRYCLKKRSVLLERDPDLQDTLSTCKGNSQESLEESQPEEIGADRTGIYCQRATHFVALLLFF
uniref:leucine-rich repeat-containing protein 31-like n=1 Tax=Maylandia zebra TaxID=106582 RepID=UPI000D2F6EBA|nr:leucine-rich repeat-containing protein 31-like [Maylandia zebra]